MSGVFAIVVFLSFGLVAMASYYYEDGGQITNTVWKSDSDTIFSEFSYPEQLGLPVNFTKGTNEKLQTTYEDGVQWNYTAIYNGNDTYIFSLPERVLNGSEVLHVFNVMMDLPNLDCWLIKNITISVSLPALNDQTLLIAIEHFTPVGSTLPYGIADAELLTLITQTSVDDMDWYNETLVLPLTTSARIYDMAQSNTDFNIIVEIYDDSLAGWDDWLCEISINIDGIPMDTWNVQTTLSTILGGTAFLNIVVAVYMTDKIDIKRGR